MIAVRIPIRRGTARRLGIRRPIAVEMTDQEFEEFKAKWRRAHFGITTEAAMSDAAEFASRIVGDSVQDMIERARCDRPPCQLVAGHDGGHYHDADLRAFKQERLAIWPTPERCHGVPQCQLADGHDGPHRWTAGNGDQMIMWPL